jgi:hypothetical protein
VTSGSFKQELDGTESSPEGSWQYQPDRPTTSRTPGRGKTASEAAELRIRYEIGEIRYEQCSGTAFYLLKWPFSAAPTSPRPHVPGGMQKTWQTSRPGSSIRRTSSLPSTRTRRNRAAVPTMRHQGVHEERVSRIGVGYAAVLTASRARCLASVREFTISRVRGRLACRLDLARFPRRLSEPATLSRCEADRRKELYG